MKKLMVVFLSSALLLTGMPSAIANESSESNKSSNYLQLEEKQLVRILIPGTHIYNAMQDAGYDFAGGFERVPNGIEVDAILTKKELDSLPDLGVSLAEKTSKARISKQQAPKIQEAQEEDTVVIGRVDWFTTKGQGFLSVEAKSSAKSNAVLTLSWGDGSQEMDSYVDSGEYMYHRVLAKVDGPRPDRITVTSSLGTEETAAVNDWLANPENDIDRPGYQSGFFDEYKNPTELFTRIDELAEEYPELTEIVELPYRTNGYRRHAQAQFGSGNSTFYVTSNAYGHEGGNDISLTVVKDADSPTISVNGKDITVHIADDTTAKELVDVINADSVANKLVKANLYRATNGTGVVDERPKTQLDDFLGAPEEISRDPFPMRALRIGKNRDGSKPGVLIVAQDHAREWVTPLVALESAERLLANYQKDAKTRQIVDNVDILIIPSNNPDGAHYSFFDNNRQRRNMTNHCGPENSDPGRRNNWGVDLNRNYSIGSVHDGFTGGSLLCTSDTFAGPEELSEPEAKNVVWLAENYSNIKFFMTIHSYGGQLFWQPGSYKADGRVTTPRPPLRDEQYYWQMAEEILSSVKGQRDTVVQPRNVGGSSDVLYSSAGNVREELYNNYGIYAFGWEVGGEQWNTEQQSWLAPGGFQPVWKEANQQYMEYASGVMKMFELAMEYGKDHNPANTKLISEQQADGTYHVTFSLSEPATVYYTTDGSKPTYDSPTYEPPNIREPGEVFEITEDTTFRWFSKDVKGNVENRKKFTVKVNNKK
ncbi:M14 family zinc carboxypeptidase [Bacillus sp. T33-2]|uniref:M14 family zinc carboxypeptidase n=1 Tax=Bacillus sp. T33-2 TaxID=2054168 RepID=UPI000C78185B|nr:M14 family zinc carboxypeptidase [Bacillus sp. T33-2]PLR91662.1 zinc carboxypeptidase [Bacillus sp. T33-2]